MKKYPLILFISRTFTPSPSLKLAIIPTLTLALTLFTVQAVQAAEATQAIETKQPQQTKDSTHELIRHLLAQNLGTRKFPFPDVIFAATGKRVIPVNQHSSSHQAILKAIKLAASQTLIELNQTDSPVRKLRRINEASRYFEDLLLKKINAMPQFSCTIPRNTKGNHQRSGYPDLLITHISVRGEITQAYLDPKLFEEKSRASSLRTFYFEPRTHTNKIQHDALHLLLGISHDGHQQAWIFTGWHLCDLSKFQVRLKAEFQASNRDLYRNNIILRSSEP